MKTIIIFLMTISIAVASTLSPKEVDVLAPGWNDNLDYDIPKPGTYKLNPIHNAYDGIVIDDNGVYSTLFDQMDGKITLLSFIYSTCSDINGCPLSMAVFYKIQDKLKKNKKLRNKVRLISLSFDPEIDTPEVMKLYGKNLKSDDLDWSFLTTKSYRELNPIIEAYSQPVIRKYDDSGNYKGVDSHILRVFLIDSNKVVRNIYSVSFLHSKLLINDIINLSLEK